MGLHLSRHAEADALLDRDASALLIGMLLDQQIPMESAFTGPYTIATRLGRESLDPAEIALVDPEKFAALLAERPAVHRYPGSMARRVQDLCRFIVDRYEGDTAALWRDAVSGKDLLRRLRALPGFGDRKARIFLALLGKQLSVRPEGWREAAGDFGVEDAALSIADVTDDVTLQEVRARKQALKQRAENEETGR